MKIGKFEVKSNNGLITSIRSVSKLSSFVSKINAAFSLIRKTFLKAFTIKQHCDYQKDEIIIAFDKNPKNLDLVKLALKFFKKDEEFVLELIRINPQVFNLLDKKSKEDKPFVIKAIKANSDVAKFITQKVKQDESFMKSVVMLLVDHCSEERLNQLIPHLDLVLDNSLFLLEYGDTKTEVLTYELLPADIQHRALQKELASIFVLKQAVWADAASKLDDSLAAKLEASIKSAYRAKEIECERLGLPKNSSETAIQEASEAHKAECEKYGIDPLSTKKQLEQIKLDQKKKKIKTFIETYIQKMKEILSLNERITSLKRQLQRYDLPALRKQFEDTEKQQQALIAEIKENNVLSIESLKGLLKDRLELEESIRKAIIDKHQEIFGHLQESDEESEVITTSTVQAFTQHNPVDLSTELFQTARDVSRQVQKQVQNLAKKATTVITRSVLS